MRPDKNRNLSNTHSEPEHAPLICTVSVHFDAYRGPFPVGKLLRWLTSLPDNADITMDSRSNKPEFTATWTEER